MALLLCALIPPSGHRSIEWHPVEAVRVTLERTTGSSQKCTRALVALLDGVLWNKSDETALFFLFFLKYLSSASPSYRRHLSRTSVVDSAEARRATPRL